MSAQESAIRSVLAGFRRLMQATVDLDPYPGPPPPPRPPQSQDPGRPLGRRGPGFMVPLPLGTPDPVGDAMVASFRRAKLAARREVIATAALTGLALQIHDAAQARIAVRCALFIADALIAELDAEGGER